MIATGVQYSVRQFIEKSAVARGMQLRWEGNGVAEVAYWQNPTDAVRKAHCVDAPVPIIRVDPLYYRPTDMQTLLGDPTKAKEKLGWVPKITLDQMVAEMVANDLQKARRHALLKENGYRVSVSVE